MSILVVHLDETDDPTGPSQAAKRLQGNKALKQFYSNNMLIVIIYLEKNYSYRIFIVIIANSTYYNYYNYYKYSINIL